jgi:hypothetical protein
MRSIVKVDYEIQVAMLLWVTIKGSKPKSSLNGVKI